MYEQRDSVFQRGTRHRGHFPIPLRGDKRAPVGNFALPHFPPERPFTGINAIVFAAFRMRIPWPLKTSRFNPKLARKRVLQRETRKIRSRSACSRISSYQRDVRANGRIFLPHRDVFFERCRTRRDRTRTHTCVRVCGTAAYYAHYRADRQQPCRTVWSSMR